MPSLSPHLVTTTSARCTSNREAVADDGRGRHANPPAALRSSGQRAYAASAEEQLMKTPPPLASNHEKALGFGHVWRGGRSSSWS